MARRSYIEDNDVAAGVRWESLRYRLFTRWGHHDKALAAKDKANGYIRRLNLLDVGTIIALIE